MQFHYIASQQDGKIIENDINANNVEEVLAYLASHGIKPVSIRSAEEKRTLKLFRGSVTIEDQIFISKYMTLMLRIGTGLLEAINILIADFDKPAVRTILLEIRSALEQGKQFYTTFAQYPKIFSSVFINLIRAGETSGNLEKTFDDLTIMLTKQKDLHDSVKSALVYPLILLITAFVIVVFIVIFALPKVAKVFLEGGFEPPAFSKAVFSVGLFMQEYGLYVIGAFIIVIMGGVYFYRASLFGKKIVFNILRETPVVKDILNKIALQRFGSILSSLIKAGLPIVNALEVTASAVGNPALQEALLRIAHEGLLKGVTLGESFRREPFFPMSVKSLVSIAEKAGHLGEVLGTLSDFYTKEIDGAVKRLVTFLEPILLLGIGMMVGAIALAIIIPIYQLTSQF